MPRDNFDVIIIGAGIVGCLIARFLSRYELSVLLLDKEYDVGTGSTSRNTAIIHAGYDPTPGTLKAEMNVTGNRMWDTLAGDLDIPFRRPGNYVIASGEKELPVLDDLRKRGIQNGVKGIRILSKEEILRREPNINPQVSGALWVPTTGIIDPFAAVVAAGENAVLNGVNLLLGTAFEDFLMKNKRIIGIKTNRGCFLCRWVVNAAGLYCDQVMHKAGVHLEFEIKPRKGEYAVLDRAEFKLDRVLFPVPTSITKGVLIAPTIQGNIIVGPNSHPIEDREDTATTTMGLKEIWQEALKLIPRLDQREIIGNFAGVRASGNAFSENLGATNKGDFLIERSDQVQGLLNLGGIESPGLASSPAIALRVVELLKDAGERLIEKRNWNPIRPARPRFRDLSREEKKHLIQSDPRYARIICRCESVTEGEVSAEIHAPIQATTYDAIKRRTWLGTGRCQGAFDTPRILEILARELGISPLEVSKMGPGSKFLFRQTKEVKNEG